MTKKLLNIFTILLITTSINAQAGSGVFQFLNLPTGARQAAFGGTNITLYDNDLNFAFANPALLSEKTHNFLGLNYTNLFNDVNLGSAIYGRNFSDKDFMAFGIHYVDYVGIFDTEEQLDSFKEKNCIDCKRYKRNCTLLRNAIEGRIQDEIDKFTCTKRTCLTTVQNDIKISYEELFE